MELPITEMRNKPLEIKDENITLIKKLGSGSFGTVYEADCYGNSVAVKIPNIKEITNEDMSDLLNEISVMTQYSHENIITVYGACIDISKFRIVMELMDGNLETLLKNEKKLSLYQKLLLMKGAATGLSWLHSIDPPVIHRDLKLENLMYKKTGDTYIVKVCDFGLSVIKPKSQSLVGRGEGNMVTMSPEIMLNKEYDEKADIYSFSIMLWEVATDQMVFPNYQKFEDFETNVAKGKERPPIPGHWPMVAKQLLTRMWADDPTERPSFLEVIKRIDKWLLYAALGDEDAVKFWKKYWGTEIKNHTVPWEIFIDCLFDHFRFFPQFINCALKNANDQHFLKNTEFSPHYWSNVQCLRAMLVDNNQNVSIEKLGKILEWFGPFSLKDNVPTFINKMRQIMKKSWFYGNISGDDAKIILKNAADRDNRRDIIIVRFSTSLSGCFSVAYWEENQIIRHAQIIQDISKPNREFLLNFTSPVVREKSLINLVENHWKESKKVLEWKFSFCFNVKPNDILARGTDYVEIVSPPEEKKENRNVTVETSEQRLQKIAAEKKAAQERLLLLQKKREKRNN